ncbi:hypothetical protein V7S43_010559 [Phytophthora oleae]|uniref:Uncharacterized protein n=1 Tax=Phytophthora oleae TaxID=2107226 RepID=A0ABD3FBG1_9STRA
MIGGEKILPTETVDFWLEKSDMLLTATNQIHVLVVLPEDVSGTEAARKTKLTSLEKLLKDSEASGELSVQGDF